MAEFKKRKTTRLQNADYNENGTYFITLCTQNKRCVLSRITKSSEGPAVEMLPYGKIAEKYIRQLNDFYNDISIERYVIMPNHIHILMCVETVESTASTVQNSSLSKFISTFKRFTNKDCGKNIWQYRSYDHIIRNEKDYEEHANYVYYNPLRWHYDELYTIEKEENL